MARRFIVEDKDMIINEKKNNNNKDIVITGTEVKHMQVLRKNVGDTVIVNSSEYVITKMKRDSISLEYIKETKSIGVPNVNLTLFVAMLKNDKMDFVVQKAVELGVKKIVPFFSTNVVVKLDEKAKIKRKDRLQKIAIEACKQCGRTDEVLVSDFLNFGELLESINEEKVLFAYEASNDSLKNEMLDIKEKGYKNIAVIIGAEGGFTSKEAEELIKLKNVSAVSLGERILRAETAALTLLGIVMYEVEL